MMDYIVACKLCGAEHHRREYKKRGGGVHKMCKACRAQANTERWRAKAQIMNAKRALKQEQLERAVHMLTAEYNRATGQNRTKIKALSSNPKPTRATIKSLAVRQTLQVQWDAAYSELLEKLYAGEQYQSLRSYMENRQCLDTHLLSKTMEQLESAKSSETGDWEMRKFSSPPQNYLSTSKPN